LRWRQTRLKGQLAQAYAAVPGSVTTAAVTAAAPDAGALPQRRGLCPYASQDHERGINVS